MAFRSCSRVAGARGAGLVAALVTGFYSGPAFAADDPTAVCSERLKSIHRALIAYERDHQEWPDHLSDLVPKYLPDAASLLDPADPGADDLGSTEAHGDPKLRVSYSYERTASISNGLAQPLGTFPKPDIAGTGWGSWRLVNGRMETFFGDQVPLLRCYHHRPPEVEREPGTDCVLNLTPAGRVYKSEFDWRHHPDSVEFLLRTLERDLSQGEQTVLRTWNLGRLDEFFSYEPPMNRERIDKPLAAVAERFLRGHREFKDNERTVCRLAARFFRVLEEPSRAIEALDTAGHYPAGEWQPIVEDQLRASIYHSAKRCNDEIATYRSLLERRPDVRPYMESLANALEAMGKSEQARLWRDKADPGRRLVGKPAPPFNLTLVNSSTLTLDSALGSRKAVLLDFWFCACGPCRLAFPHWEKLHVAHRSHGLSVIAVNSGDSKDAVERFGQEHKASFTLAVGRQGEKDNPIFQAYHVTTFPTTFLINDRGTIVWRGVGFGSEAKHELAEALAKIGIK
jgi:peroxiredoxin